jgi:hypothetical protein
LEGYKVTEQFFTIITEKLKHPISDWDISISDFDGFDWFYSDWSEDQKLYAVKTENPFGSKGVKALLWNLFQKQSCPEWVIIHTDKDPKSLEMGRTGFYGARLYRAGNGSLEDTIAAIAPIEKMYLLELKNARLSKECHARSIRIDSFPLWINPDFATQRIQPSKYILPVGKSHFCYGIVGESAYLMEPIKNVSLNEEIEFQSGIFLRQATLTMAIQEKDKDSFLYVGPFGDELILKEWIISMYVRNLIPKGRGF